MSGPDLFNGAFEAVGSVAVWFNVARLWKDKNVQGTNWRVMIFFSSWSLWNMYYYPHLHQWLSFAGGCSLTMANLVWTVMAAWYMRSKP